MPAGFPSGAAPASTMTSRSRWQWIGAIVAMTAAIVTLFMFMTGIQSIPDLVEFVTGRTATPSASDQAAPLRPADPALRPGDPGRGEPAAPARGEPDGRATPPRPSLPPPQALEAEDQRKRRYPVEVALESVVRRESDTLVRIALTYRGTEAAQYLLHAYREGQDRLGARDEFYLTDAGGARHAWSGQQGAIATERVRGVGTLCVPLPRGVRQSFDLVFPAVVPEGPVTLLHVRSPRIFSYVDCPAGTTVALPDFSFRYPGGSD